MVAQGKVLWSGDAGKTWHEQSLQIAADVADNEIRWVRELPALPSSEASPHEPGSPRGSLLAGTAKGLYRRAGVNGVWQLVQRGLPTGEPIAWCFDGGILVVAMRGGGLYVSRDSSQTWDRVDSGELIGPI